MSSPLALPYKIILGSQSPRRKSLLEGLGIPFEVHVIPTKEEFDPEGGPAKVATALALDKGNCFKEMLKTDPTLLVITADTIVSVGDKILNKPVDRDDAFRMIKILNGNNHTVFTGVAITTINNQEAFVSSTNVYFNELSDEEIYYYIDSCKPYDKAGSYGVQEWIGYVGIRSIEGDFFNVMGLPLNALYEKLKKYSK